MRPKIHVIEHVAMEFKYKNPRYYTNYLGEDAVRRVKQLASSAPVRFMSHHVIIPLRPSDVCCASVKQMRA